MALQNFDKATHDDLHFSGVMTLSREDKLRIREILVQAIEHNNKIIADSKEEEICCVSVDLFSLKR